ncbi:MAG TPA: hypothetical protein VK427_02130, partial [Kofleriaceae bacterium]|nr:hypothetical protein [Kofleriaceae bacterium]
MSGPSSLCSLGLVLIAAACSSNKGKLPEADPAALAPVLAEMVKTFPGPGMKECDGSAVVGGATMTATTFFKLAKYKFDLGKPEYQEYVNPGELDSPAARTLADDRASEKDKRQAAAELLRAPFFLVYHVDLVNAPMALEIKELKRGTVGARAMRFDKHGRADCVR